MGTSLVVEIWQAGIWQGLELVEERRPEEYAFVSTAARDMASAADR